MVGRVLIVDPVPTNRIVLKVKLAIAHYDVSVADSVQQARQLASTTQFEAILVSTRLVTNDTECALHWARSEQASANSPLSFLFMHDPGQHHTTDMIDKCLQSGTNDCIRRPFVEQELLARLRNLMRNQARLCELKAANKEITWIDPPSEATKQASTHIAISHIGSSKGAHCPFQGHDFLVAINPINTIETIPLSVLMQPNTRHCEPGVVILVSQSGMAEHTLSILSHIKSHSRLHNTRIILIMKNPNPEQLAYAFDLGADEAMSQETPLSEIAARVNHQARIFSGILRRKHVVKESLRQAITDPLTGLHNRRYAQSRLEQIHSESNKSGQPFAVLALDIDHFKNVNDSFGHMIGDTVLVALAKTLRKHLHEGDLICRMGGEEFLVALPDTSNAQATATANRLRKAIGALNIKTPLTASPLQVTVSIGLALQEGRLPVSGMLEKADQALYVAKSRGRNIVSISTSAA